MLEVSIKNIPHPAKCVWTYEYFPLPLTFSFWKSMVVKKDFMTDARNMYLNSRTDLRMRSLDKQQNGTIYLTICAHLRN